MFKFPQRGRERSAAVLAGIGLALAPAALPALSPALAPLPAVQAQQSSKPVLRIGAIPDQQPEKLNRLYGLVANELSKQLGVKVQYVPVTNYAAAVSAFRTGNLDLVWFGGLTGVQARLQKPGAKVLAQRDIDASFHTIFIANTKSGLKPVTNVQGLSQLKGKGFAKVDQVRHFNRFDGNMALAHQGHDDGAPHQIVTAEQQTALHRQLAQGQQIFVGLQCLGVLAVGGPHAANGRHTQGNQIAVGLG